MRPVRLKVKGFTAFRDEQNIEFSDLDVFAIAGETGSGKSSILDAMTYALFGYVERVGKQVGQLVSQGQPRLVVTLEFAVGADRYRITRSTPARGGATKVMLERSDGEGWTQYGEGADRVRECNEIVRRLIGLDYPAFTRSVVLPQGKFAEFLTGDPKERRDILTELLGLSIFERMAKHANSLGKDERLRAENMRELLDREYAGVTEEAAKDAGRLAKESRTRERKLATAGTKVVGLLEQFEAGRRASEELRACAEEATTFSERARAVQVALVELEERARDSEAALAACETRMKQAEDDARKAAEGRVEAEESWGSATDLAALRVKAEGLAGVTARIARTNAEREAAEARIEELAGALGAREGELEAATTADEDAQAALAEARKQLQKAEHADLAATLSAGLKKGDPCPVCGEPLDAAPKAPGARALQGVRSAMSAAEKAASRAVDAVRKAERARDAAQRDLLELRSSTKRLAKELADVTADLEAMHGAVASAFDDELPGDPVAVLTERLSELERLSRGEREAARASEEAARSRDNAERELGAVRAEILAERTRLEFDIGPLVQRSRRAAAGQLAAPRLPRLPASGAVVDALAKHAGRVGEVLEGFAVDLEERNNARDSVEATLLAKARHAAGDVAPDAHDLPELARELNEEIRRAGEQAATAEHSANAIEERLVTRTEMEQEATTREARGSRLRALAAELRADRVIAFLQAEALQMLASGGSERLASLSGGRYRLTCAGDEFSVIDTWNGDEERSVRTLSGGETFLASLCLALALSEQVRSLSVTERARLDSLFLDEGFGTLDPEALRVVVDAIEQLAGGGRLVGVITHVRELAEQFPRLEVAKSPRGSTVRFVS